MNEKQEHILRYCNVPLDFRDLNLQEMISSLPFGQDEINKWVSEFGFAKVGEKSLIIESTQLRYRSLYRKVAYAILFYLVKEGKISRNAYYITKPELIDYWSLYRRNQSGEDTRKTKKGDNWKSADLLIIDGIDGWKNNYELPLLESFVVPTVQNGVPIIFLSSHVLDDDFVEQNGGLSLISTILDYSVTVTVR